MAPPPYQAFLPCPQGMPAPQVRNPSPKLSIGKYRHLCLAAFVSAACIVVHSDKSDNCFLYFTKSDTLLRPEMFLVSEFAIFSEYLYMILYKSICMKLMITTLVNYHMIYAYVVSLL